MTAVPPADVGPDIVAQSEAPGSGQASVRKRRKVTRTRSGCLTCRRRRKACDMAKPNCGACVRLKMDCSWPSIREGVMRSSPPISRQNSTAASSGPSNSVVPLVPSPWDSSVTDLANIFGAPIDPPALDSVTTDARFPGGDHGGSSAARLSVDVGTGDLDNALLNDIDFNELLLQSWAADCLAGPAMQTQDPFHSLSSILDEHNRSSISREPVGSRPSSPTARHHGPLLQHYQRSLSSLVSCTDENTPSAFHAFSRLATAQSSSEPGRGLHLAILAWAGRHMSNEGQAKYEAISERLGGQAAALVLEQAARQEPGSMSVDDSVRLTLLGGLLMVVQWKICRGDVWGYDQFVKHLSDIASLQFTPTSSGAPPDSMSFSFFENLLYHDLLSARVYSIGPIIPYDTLQLFSSQAVHHLNTLTGACLPLFIKMHRIASLTKRCRGRREWNDDTLVDTVEEAETLENELKEEKKRMDAMVQRKPEMASHRYLHEAFRIACLLSLYTFVFKTPPSALRVRLLVRQSLSLLEQMHDQSLPGYCSSHWVIFVTALCCSPRGQPEGDLDDCERIGRLYDDFEDDWAFRNIGRSRKIADEVRRRNSDGKVHVDWLDVVEEYEWELWLV